MIADFATFTRDCIDWLDYGPGRGVWSTTTDRDAPTPIYDETRYFLSNDARPGLILSADHGATWGNDAHPLAAWLPLLGWLFFAGCVALLVWAVWS